MQRLSVIAMFIPVVIISCLEPYQPPEIKDNPNHLVVDAFLNSTDGNANVRLSRTVSLSSTDVPPAELQAKVSIEDEHGVIHLLNEIESGNYSMVGLPVNPSLRYRLNIQTSGNKKYVSDFISIKQTPDIDSIAWTLKPDGIDIHVSTHDASAGSRYYRWHYTETWEYTAKHYAGYKVMNGLVDPLQVEESPYRCWKTDPLTKILVGSTNRLREDVVSNFTLLTIPRSSIRLGIKYSILVRQQALSEEAFTYWLNLQKTTESLGGLFDPLPSQVEGNIFSVSDPDDFVIGYFSAGAVKEKRIFIKPSDLPENFSTFRHPFCEVDTILNEEIPDLWNSTLLLSPVYAEGFPVIIGYTSTSNNCMNCKVYGGGATTKPDFWE